MTRTSRHTSPGGRTALLAGVLGLVLVVLGMSLVNSEPVAAARDLHPPPLAAGAVEPRVDAQPATSPVVPPVEVPLPLPTRVALPEQHVAAVVLPIGVTRSRSLDLPADPRAVGWWSGGPVPGAATGSAVLAGHIDSAKSGIGAFAALLRVAVGDPIDVTSADGSVRHYRVTARSTYRKTALPAAVFGTDGPAGLTLVTCGGPYDSRTHHYRDNVVVIAQPVEGP